MYKILTLILIFSSCNVLKTLTGEDTKVPEDFLSSKPISNHPTEPQPCHYTSNTAASDSLKSGLLEFFHFEETSGNRNGSSGSIDLIQTGNINSIAGHCGNALDSTTQDGSNYLTPSNSSSLAFGSSTDFTITFWVRFDPTTSGYQFIQGDSDAGSVDNYIGFYINGSGDVQLEVWMITVNGLITYPTGLTTDSTWHHFALVFDRDTNTKAYIDGTLATTAGATSSSNQTLVATETITQRIYGAVNSIYGGIDEFGIWTRALSHSEVQELHNLEYNF